MANGDSVEFVLIECERWIGQSGNNINGSAISIASIAVAIAFASG